MGEATQAVGKPDTGAMYKTLGKLKADQQQFAGAMILEGEHKGEAAQALVAEKAGHFFVIGKDGKATEIKDENIKDLDTAKAAVRQAISSGKFPSTLPLDAEKFLKAASSNDGADPKAGTGGTDAEKKAAAVAAQKAQLVALYNKTIANPKQVVELGAGDKKSKIAIAKIGDANVVIDAQGRATALDAASKDAASLTPAIKQALEKAVNAGQFGGEAVAAETTTPTSGAGNTASTAPITSPVFISISKDNPKGAKVETKDGKTTATGVDGQSIELTTDDAAGAADQIKEAEQQGKIKLGSLADFPGLKEQTAAAPTTPTPAATPALKPVAIPEAYKQQVIAKVKESVADTKAKTTLAFNDKNNAQTSVYVGKNPFGEGNVIADQLGNAFELDASFADAAKLSNSPEGKAIIETLKQQGFGTAEFKSTAVSDNNTGGDAQNSATV